MVLSLAIASGALPLLATQPSMAAPAPVARHATTWLCRPGQVPDPCAGHISYASVPAVGAAHVVHVTPATHAPVDCFYAYPTVSGQTTPNATLAVDPAETFIATDQAAPFSQVCRVFAPMYHQMTVPELFSTDTADKAHALSVAYASLARGFAAFLAAEPAGRHFVLLGHSQGAALLIELIAKVIDPNPALRARLVSALLLGGNLTVATGKDIDGAFHHIPLCRSSHELSCAIAYSSFYATPPATSYFGIPGQGVSLLWGQTSRSTGLSVACVNPADFGTTSAPLDVRFLDGDHAGASYVTYPGLYRAACEHRHGATFLHVTAASAPSVPGANERPLVVSAGRNWGLHDDDVNLTTGDLVTVVGDEEHVLAHGR
jgi:hypothetical protein